MHLNSPLPECWTSCRAASSSGTAWVDNAHMRGRSLLGQSSRYLAMTRPVPAKPFKAWSMIVILIPVYDILILSQSHHLSAPNWHALSYWLAYTMTDTDGFVTVGPIAMKFGWDNENVSCLKFTKFHLNPTNFNRKLTMMFKLDLLIAFRTPVQNGLMQKVNIFCRENEHLHAFYAPTKNRTNWMRASC